MMKNLKSPPKWAQELVLDACEWWENQGNHVPLFFIDCKNASKRGYWKGKYSSGQSFSGTGRILFILGKDRKDAKLVLLHELAHQLSPSGEHHGPKFWDIAWSLFRWAKLPIKYCLWREGAYRKGAIVSFHKGVKESKKLKSCL